MRSLDELDARRIQQQSRLRRSAYRARSYALIGTAACTFAAIQLAVFAWNSQGKLARFIYALVALSMVYLALKCARSVRALNREMKSIATGADETSAPDFSTLSDGSQFAKNLERL